MRPLPARDFMRRPNLFIRPWGDCMKDERSLLPGQHSKAKRALERGGGLGRGS